MALSQLFRICQPAELIAVACGFFEFFLSATGRDASGPAFLFLQSLCGWSDDGQALLAFALREPKQARWCWSRLMDTDGLRGDIHPKTKEWTWGYLRLDVRRVLSALQRFHGLTP